MPVEFDVDFACICLPAWYYRVGVGYTPKARETGMSGSKGQRAAQAMLVQHEGPRAFTRQTSTFSLHREMAAAAAPTRQASESAGFKQKLPRISAVGSNCVRYTVRLVERGAGPVVKYHPLAQNDQLSDRRGRNGKRLIRSSAVRPTNKNAVHTEFIKLTDDGDPVYRDFWVQQLGVRWLLTATLFGDRVITQEFSSKKSAMSFAEQHADQSLPWARSRGRGKRARRKKAPVTE